GCCLMSSLPTFADVQAAARRLESVVIRTPLLENPRVNDKLGGRLFIKAECLQRTGSFKIRGAYNFLSSMSEADRMKESREEIGMGIAEKTGATVVPPYDHPWILTGQGTAGLELAEQAKALGVTLDAVAAPCSGGGLSTGVALGVKGIMPNASVHAGEPAGFDDLARSLASGKKEKNEKLSGSICDALLAPTPGDVIFPLAQKVLGPGLVVSDDEVLDAMEVAFREFKIVVEPGGAVALAAALTGKLPVKGRTVAVVCSGGNVDHATFIRALSRQS